MDGWTICPVFFSPLVELVLYSPSKALPQLCPIASSICYACIISQKLRLILLLVCILCIMLNLEFPTIINLQSSTCL
jgi:hypothetical protein